MRVLPVETRKACAADIEAIVELWKELTNFHLKRDPHFKPSTTADEAFAAFVGEQIEKDDSLVLVAEDGDTVVAYALAVIATRPPVFEETRYGAVYDLLVTDSHRRQGIGEHMVRKIERWFAERSIRRIDVRVSTRNEVSTRFWRKLGYEPYLETLYREI